MFIARYLILRTKALIRSLIGYLAQFRSGIPLAISDVDPVKIAVFFDEVITLATAFGVIAIGQIDLASEASITVELPTIHQ